jgi:hypothetical protein
MPRDSVGDISGDPYSPILTARLPPTIFSTRVVLWSRTHSLLNSAPLPMPKAITVPMKCCEISSRATVSNLASGLLPRKLNSGFDPLAGVWSLAGPHRGQPGETWGCASAEGNPRCLGVRKPASWLAHPRRGHGPLSSYSGLMLLVSL